MITVLVFDNTKLELVINKLYDLNTTILQIKNEILCLYNRNVQFQLKNKKINLHDNTQLKDLNSEILCFNFFSEAIVEDKDVDLVKLLVRKDRLSFRNGIVSIRNNFINFDMFNSLFKRISKDFLVKCSFILFLIVMKNSEMAVLIILFIILNLLSKRTFTFKKKIEGIVGTFFKVVTLFFYTMFVINGDDQVIAQHRNRREQ